MAALEINVQLDEPNRQFATGEEITGVVVVTVDKATKCRELSITLDCSRQSGVDTGFLFDGAWEAGSTYEYPFKLRIEAELPSYRGTNLVIDWWIEASASRARSFAKSARRYVWVASRLHELEDIEETRQAAAAAVPRKMVGSLLATIGRGLRGTRPDDFHVEVSPETLRGGDEVSIEVTRLRTGSGTQAPTNSTIVLTGVEHTVKSDGEGNDTQHREVLHTEECPLVWDEAGRGRVSFTLPDDAVSISHGSDQVAWMVTLRTPYALLFRTTQAHLLWVFSATNPTIADALRVDGIADASHGYSKSGRYAWLGLWGGAMFYYMLIAPLLWAGQAPLPALVALSVAPLAGWALYRAHLAMGYQVRRRVRTSPPSATRVAPPPGGAHRAAADVPAPPPMSIRLIDADEYAPTPELVAKLAERVGSLQAASLRNAAACLAMLVPVGAVATVALQETAIFVLFFPVMLTFAVIAASLGSPLGRRALSARVGMAPFLLFLWSAVFVTIGVLHARSALTSGRIAVSVAALVLMVFPFFVWAYRRRKMSAVTTGAAPITLLVLWVFGHSSRMEHLLSSVWSHWCYLGPAQFLQGPSASRHWGNFVRYVTGRRQDLVAETEDHAAALINRFRTGVTGWGTYSKDNTIQCGDTSWRHALDLLLESSDVVLMDLCGFDGDDRGCEYEMSLLIDRVPTRHFLLVVDANTDYEALKASLGRAWAAMSTDSPNRAPESARIRVFRRLRAPQQVLTSQFAKMPDDDIVMMLCEDLVN